MIEHKILHLCTDGNFIEKSISVFEYFYPSQNVFCMKPKTKSDNYIYVENSNVIKFNPYRNADYLDEMESLNNKEHFDIIAVHGLSEEFNKIIKRINSDRKKKVYWIFWGYELYYSLGEQGKFPLIDNQNLFSLLSWITPTKYNCFERRVLRKGVYHEWLEEFLNIADYFCFWLYEDYLLLKKFYPNQLGFRHFQYDACFRSDKRDMIKVNYKKNEYEIRIGHSASKTSNHVTIMKLLKEIDKENRYKKIFPLAYGSKYVKGVVLKVGKRYFGDQFVPVVGYVSSEEYYDSLSKVGVAIFGQLRQEASGNIFPLIKYGAKVFLRKKNPLYAFCKRIGYVIFSVEDDLKSIEDLCLLSQEQMEHNANVAFSNQVFYEDFMPTLFE